MKKTKINFEIEQQILANARAYVARHGGSLNKIVSALFASLGQEEQRHLPAIDPAKKILLDVRVGKISIMEAARLLKLPDAGYVLHRLAEERLPLPALKEEDVRQQLVVASNALDACLIDPVATAGKRKMSRLAR